ncbi:MAG: UDP-2,3-diacylglucosamine pyrophosphatase, partial [Hyphomicrobiales bacterium]|nr:UDP-2,3-diacylglucosamine pyrophosphatase [Hyphomicrobiales bacterium]
MSNRLALFAGSGALVPYAVAAAQQAGYKVQVLALAPRDDLTGVKVVAADLSNPLAILWSMKTFRASHMLMVGGVHLSDRTREGLIRFAGGDQPDAGPVGDASLSGLGTALKRITGATLIGIHEIAPELLAGEGLLAGPALDEAQQGAAAFGIEIARGIGALDIGQAVVISGTRVISVEDIGGTDGLLARVADYRRRGLAGDGDASLILAKTSKPQQPLYVDLPTIGADTIARASEAGIGVIAVEAGRTLLLERERLLAAANAAGISLLGIAIADG